MWVVVRSSTERDLIEIGTQLQGAGNDLAIRTVTEENVAGASYIAALSGVVWAKNGKNIAE